MATEETGRQVVIVIRHGERIDNVEYDWVIRSKRPYDPPLTEVGVKQAREVGSAFKGKVKFMILFIRRLYK